MTSVPVSHDRPGTTRTDHVAHVTAGDDDVDGAVWDSAEEDRLHLGPEHH